jgi:hypothetical protein
MVSERASPVEMVPEPQLTSVDVCVLMTWSLVALTVALNWSPVPPAEERRGHVLYMIDHVFPSRSVPK